MSKIISKFVKFYGRIENRLNRFAAYIVAPSARVRYEATARIYEIYEN
jgi:hypothetical protein